MPDWPFEDPPNTAVVTTRPVIDDGAPILLVTHELEDGGWQFLCGTTNDTAEGRVVGLGEICARDTGLLELADLPEGWRAWRAHVGAPWHRGQRSRAADESSVGPTARGSIAPRVTRGIAVYQVVVGLWGLADPARRTFAEAHTTGQYTLATLVTAFMLASVVAGALLWRGSPGGRSLSRIVQALQVPVLASKWLVYSVTLGLACSLSIRGLGPAVWFGVGPYVTIGFSPLSYVSQLGLNIVPLVLWYLLRRSPGPAPGVTAPFDESING